MQDMIEALGTLRTSEGPTPVGAEHVAADLARGHRALVRRRRFRMAGVGFTAVLAAAGATAVTAGQFGAPGQNVAGHRTSAPVVSSQPSVSTDAFQIAAYTGTQPAGFKVSTLPKGWKVTSVSQYEFVAVPPGTPDRHLPHGVVYLDDGIAVMLQGSSRFAAGEHLTKVTVQGREGQLGFTDDKTAKWLMFPGADGQKVLLQVPTKLGLTDAQIVQFAQGVTVTGEARASVG